MSGPSNFWRNSFLRVLVSAILTIAVIGYTLPWLGYNVPIPQLPSEQPPEPTSAAWERALPRIEDAEFKSAKAYEKRLAEVTKFFDSRSEGSDAFAQEVLSLKGKWSLVKHLVRIDDDHAKFLAAQFSHHLFTPDELRDVLVAAVAGYLADLESLESELLVKIAGDLDDSNLTQRTVAKTKRGEALLKKQVKKITEELAPDLTINLGVTTGSLLGTMYGPLNLATRSVSSLIVRVAAAVLSQAGFTTSFYGAGALSSVATMGVGFVVAWALDYTITCILRECGYDAEQKISFKVRESLKKTHDLLLQGTPGAVGTYNQLLRMAEKDGILSVREASRQAVTRMQQGGHLGLQWELKNLHETRAQFRKTVWRKLLVEGAPKPEEANDEKGDEP